MGSAAPSVDFVGVGLNSVDTLIRLPHFPRPDSKMQVRSSEILPGGQVATAAVACHRWGLRCRYIGKIGDDAAGRIQRESLEHEGLEHHLIQAAGCSSQQAFVLVDDSSGERTILWQRDARLDIEPTELHKDLISGGRLLHVDGHPSAPAITAAKWAHEAGMIVTSDLDNIYPDVEVLLQDVDYAICSHEFPERLLGISNLLESLPAIMRRFGCRVTGATLGIQGALAWDGSRFHYSPAFRVQVVDTTGAGDIFHAGLAYSLLCAWPLPRALEFGCAAAGLNCTAMGARGGIRPLAEIEELIRTAERHPPAFDAEALQRHASLIAASSPSSKV